MITMHLTGVDEVTRELALVLSVPRARDYFSGVTSKELHSIMLVADKLVPRRTGHLAESAYESIQPMGDKVQAEGGYTADYAVPVHEQINVKHRNGTAKFLEIPWKRWEAGSLALLAQHAKTHFIQGVRGRSGFDVRRGRPR